MHETRPTVVGAALWLLAALFLVTIVTLSVIPADEASSLVAATHVPAVAADASISSDVQDAVWHCLFYLPLTFTLLLAAAWRPDLSQRRSHRAALLVLLLIGGLGVVLEVVQVTWFGRSAEFADVVGNVAGLAMGAAAWRGIERLCRAPLQVLHP